MNPLEYLSTCVLVLSLAGSSQEPSRPDVLIADFEGEDYGTWEVAGEAFGSGPARGTLPNQMRVSGHLGKGLVNTFLHGDDTTGTLTSPPLRLERKYINFLIGGGMHPGEACIDLLVDGEVVRTATGPNDRPGGSEALDWHTWEVGELEGQSAVLRIVDRRKGGWGHVNVDHIVQSDRQAGPAPAELHRTLVVEKRYLHLPVKNGAHGRRMRFLIDGAVAREFTIELADEEPDFLVFSDVEAFRGRELSIEVDSITAGSKGLSSIVQSDEIPDPENLYRERHRPQFHFSSRRGWNNDPNGLVYFDGEYHLYYQHNPYGWKWGNMHWGHAVSRDLVRWEELPIAIYSHRFGDWVFSGGAMVDWENTGGFQTGDDPPIVASFTSTGRGECIAYSNDRGRTFADYEGNPVVEHRGRDPKIIRYAPGDHWVMAVYDEFEGKRWTAFHVSKDLRTWELASRLEGYYECPEIFELAVEGDAGNTRWVTYAADGNYAIGSFDGRTFTPESGKIRGNYGNCFYASQTFSDIPAEDGRRIQIGWGRVATPEMPFNQMMLFPCELTLRRTDEGLRMCTYPVREIENLRQRTHVPEASLSSRDNVLEGISGELFDIEAELEYRGTREIVFSIRGEPLALDLDKKRMTCHGCEAPLPMRDGRIRLRILVDRTSIEIFAGDGLVYMPVGVILPEDNRSLRLSGLTGLFRVVSLEVHELCSAWR